MLNTYMLQRHNRVGKVSPDRLAELDALVRLAGHLEYELGFDDLDRGKRQQRKQLLRRQFLGRDATFLAMSAWAIRKAA